MKCKSPKRVSHIANKIFFETDECILPEKLILKCLYCSFTHKNLISLKVPSFRTLVAYPRLTPNYKFLTLQTNAERFFFSKLCAHSCEWGFRGKQICNVCPFMKKDGDDDEDFSTSEEEGEGWNSPKRKEVDSQPVQIDYQKYFETLIEDDDITFKQAEYQEQVIDPEADEAFLERRAARLRQEEEERKVCLIIIYFVAICIMYLDFGGSNRDTTRNLFFET